VGVERQHFKRCAFAVASYGSGWILLARAAADLPCSPFRLNRVAELLLPLAARRLSGASLTFDKRCAGGNIRGRVTRAKATLLNVAGYRYSIATWRVAPAGWIQFAICCAFGIINANVLCARSIYRILVIWIWFCALCLPPAYSHALFAMANGGTAANEQYSAEGRWRQTPWRGARNRWASMAGRIKQRRQAALRCEHGCTLRIPWRAALRAIIIIMHGAINVATRKERRRCPSSIGARAGRLAGNRFGAKRAQERSWRW